MKKNTMDVIAVVLVIVVGFIFLKLWMDLRWTSIQFYGFMGVVWIGFGAFLFRERISRKMKE